MVSADSAAVISIFRPLVDTSAKIGPEIWMGTFADFVLCDQAPIRTTRLCPDLAKTETGDYCVEAAGNPAAVVIPSFTLNRYHILVGGNPHMHVWQSWPIPILNYPQTDMGTELNHVKAEPKGHQKSRNDLEINDANQLHSEPDVVSSKRLSTLCVAVP